MAQHSPLLLSGSPDSAHTLCPLSPRSARNYHLNSRPYPHSGSPDPRQHPCFRVPKFCNRYCSNKHTHTRKGWVYGRRLVFVSVRTNKRHHHQRLPEASGSFPEASGSFRDLPEASGSFPEASGSFPKASGSLPELPEASHKLPKASQSFRKLPRSFRKLPEASLRLPEDSQKLPEASQRPPEASGSFLIAVILFSYDSFLIWQEIRNQRFLVQKQRFLPDLPIFVEEDKYHWQQYLSSSTKIGHWRTCHRTRARKEHDCRLCCVNG
jgi:hypothetical protein